MANPLSLTQTDIDYLQSKVDLGTAQSAAEYYLYLSGKGYDYGTLAYQFVTDTGSAGKIGREYLKITSVAEGGTAITGTLLDTMAIDLMTRDWAARRNLIDGGNTTPVLTADTIEDYHTVVYGLHSVPILAWTPFVPLNEDPQNKEAVWADLVATSSLDFSQEGVEQALTTFLSSFLEPRMDWLLRLDDSNPCKYTNLLLEAVYSVAAEELWWELEESINAIWEDVGRLIYGSTNNGSHEGTIYDDAIFGFDGNDVLKGSAGDDFLFGGFNIESEYRNDGIDTADYSNAASGIVIDWSQDQFQVTDDGDGGKDHLESIEKIIGSDHKDKIEIEGTNWTPTNGVDPETIVLWEVDGGGGDDEITFSGAGGKVYGGGGDDILDVDGYAAEMYGGAGADTFHFSDNVLVGDASGDDRMTLSGLINLTGGVHWEGSESQWAYGLWGIKYGFNVGGEMVIESAIFRNADGDPLRTYVAGVSRDDVGPGSVQAERPLGLYVITLEAQFDRLLNNDLPKGWWSQSWRTLLGDVMKAMTGTSYYEGVDPLVLDLDGDGIELTARSSISPRFDMDGDGFAEPSGWVTGDDGLLALDANLNGTIDDVSELFGSPTVDGFSELATHDGNADGKIDALDAVFADLRVWQDANQDGLTDAGELSTLADLGIESISLASQAPATGVIAGNVVDAEGTFTYTGGATGALADVRFRIDNFDTVYLGDTTVSPEAALLPNVKGRGTLTDLHVAMTQDAALRQTVESVLPTLTATDLDSLRTAATPILEAWAAPDAAARPTIPLLMVDDGQGGSDVADFGVPLAGGVWALASGTDVLDAGGQP